MNQKDFLKALEKSYAENIEISRKKNSDYATDSNAFLNFEACSMLGIDPKVGFLVRMSDKLVRISNLINKDAQVKDESISDTLSDLANYSMIFKLYIENHN